MAQHPAQAVADFLDAARRCASVEYESDPHDPDRTIVRIVAASREAVQVEISKAMALTKAQGVTGYANFIGPERSMTGYRAHGEVVILRTRAPS